MVVDGGDAKFLAGVMLPALTAAAPGVPCAKGKGEADDVEAMAAEIEIGVAQPSAAPCLNERCRACCPRACNHSR